MALHGRAKAELGKARRGKGMAAQIDASRSKGKRIWHAVRVAPTVCQFHYNT